MVCIWVSTGREVEYPEAFSGFAQFIQADAKTMP
jgi:hypothetical protein